MIVSADGLDSATDGWGSMRMSEAQLRASEEKYRRMVESAVDAILSIDVETGRVLGGNPMACEMTSYTLEELRSRHVWALHPQDEQAEAKALFERVRAQGQGAYEDLHFLRKDGSLVAIDVRANVIEFAGRRVIQRICRDVTERKKRERALARHRAFEDLVLNLSTRFINVPADADGYDVVWGALAEIGAFSCVDRSYVYLLEAGQMSQMFVWGADGIPAFDTVRQVRLDGFDWALRRLEADETVAFERVEIYPYEGIEATARIRELAERYPCPGAGPGQLAVRRHSLSVPIRSDGRLLGFLGFDCLGQPMTWSDESMRLLRMVGNIIGNAVTRMAAARALQDANDALEQKVEQRTRELREKQAQLVQSEKMASLGQLVAGVAHEINTPLGALLSGTRTLKRTMERICIHPALVVDSARPVRGWADAAAGLTNTMQQAAERIDQVVTSLRRFAQLDRSEVRELNLQVAVEDTLTLMSAQLGAGVAVHRDYAPAESSESSHMQDVTVLCRAANVQQLLVNILLNASQAVGTNGNIWVRLRPEAEGVRIEIEDDGPGILPEVRSKIFDPGFTTKGVGVGAGLGLAIAHQIVDEHGGWIRAESPGGALLTVWLPRRREESLT